MAGAGRAEPLPAAGAGEVRGEDRATPDGMGSCESSPGRRKVSFELDEQDRVRVLQGIKVRRPGVPWGRLLEAAGAEGARLGKALAGSSGERGAGSEAGRDGWGKHGGGEGHLGG